MLFVVGGDRRATGSPKSPLVSAVEDVLMQEDCGELRPSKCPTLHFGSHFPTHLDEFE